MKKSEITIDASLVYKHGIQKIKKGRNPSIAFLGIKNPKMAFQKAKLYWDLINNLLLKLQQSEYSFISEIPQKSPNYIVRARNSDGELRNGHLDFFVITEDGKVLDSEFKTEQSFYFSSKRHYDLKDLKYDITELNKSIKIVYVILFSKITKLTILHFEQFNIIDIDFFKSPNLPFLSEEKDDIQLEEDRLRLCEEIRWKEISERRKSGEIIHLCPSCGYEWNNNYFSYCGHPH